MSAAQKPPEPPPGADWSHPTYLAFSYLVRQGSVLLAVSSAFPGVAPEAVRAAGPSACLRFGLNLSPRITDFAWNHAELVGTLSFGGKPFTCRVPWAAVVAMKLDGAPSVPSAKPPRGGHLRLVP